MDVDVTNGYFVVMTGDAKRRRDGGGAFDDRLYIEWRPAAGVKSASLTPQQAMALVAAIAQTATLLREEC